MYQLKIMHKNSSVNGYVCICVEITSQQLSLKARTTKTKHKKMQKKNNLLISEMFSGTNMTKLSEFTTIGEPKAVREDSF